MPWGRGELSRGWGGGGQDKRLYRVLNTWPECRAKNVYDHKILAKGDNWPDGLLTPELFQT